MTGPATAPGGRTVTLLAAGSDVYVFPAGDGRIDLQVTVLIGANLDVERHTVPEAGFDDAVWPQLSKDGINVVDCRPGELVGSAALAGYTGYGIDCDGVRRTIDGATVGVDGTAVLIVGGSLDSGLKPARLVVRAGAKVRVYGSPAADRRRQADAGVVQP
ncbi:hypothetical protein [Dactylosporangium sp. NPDC048998]|uniref:hypothetical protein n=1 Tax=Dactylosporangium sp. NPDC048998 TaxID=3363976 RepID=UPI0037177CFB